ncbi:MarC family protein [Kovacikia minuta CCNUW1]|uniref:MarC family protein n=1 Tax=Kovacikia minuta TaxID=2931930 RepID=UPI001CCB547D|nr:MarC family protein [Kovacikia minuta]UBF29224.1 MarC family protein [Kovacikia minuta CCNUW1]
MFGHVIGDAVTLFVIIDPIGLVPLFLAMTKQETSQNRSRIILRGVIISGIILLSFIVLGQFLLDELGISLPAFMIAGGIILLIIGLKMVLEDEPEKQLMTTQPSPDEAATHDVAVFPLAMPFIAGPGAIMAVVLLTDNDKFTVSEQIVTAGVLLGILVLTYLILLTSEWMQQILGNTGVNVVTRVMGLIVASLAVETLLEGINHFFLGK